MTLSPLLGFADAITAAAKENSMNSSPLFLRSVLSLSASSEGQLVLRCQIHAGILLIVAVMLCNQAAPMLSVALPHCFSLKDQKSEKMVRAHETGHAERHHLPIKGPTFDTDVT